jgi:hypothetical protein
LVRRIPAARIQKAATAIFVRIPGDISEDERPVSRTAKTSPVIQRNGFGNPEGPVVGTE